MNDVVVDNEHDAPSLAVTLELVQQMGEQQRVLVLLLGWIQRKESELRSDERRLRNYIAVRLQNILSNIVILFQIGSISMRKKKDERTRISLYEFMSQFETEQDAMEYMNQSVGKRPILPEMRLAIRKCRIGVHLVARSVRSCSWKIAPSNTRNG